ncbi:hypothetical protein DSM19430T_23010 [Desulfovibrio psychrotolerans]|uniref:Uncharacterized protein n=1 Tax=Desulfovibrio psychrotolerans TaxID=415242 RepID=A0A7J0BV88_9BACT|nr:hypothetical protein DSM19430T_23010 [Desulfovibrio psychrotolerans]
MRATVEYCRILSDTAGLPQPLRKTGAVYAPRPEEADGLTATGSQSGRQSGNQSGSKAGCKADRQH